MNFLTKALLLIAAAWLAISSSVAAEPKLLATLQGHTGHVFSVAFSPDGQTLASAGDTTIKLWDVATGMERATLKGHAGFVLFVSYSPDGKTLASAGGDTLADSGEGDRTIKLWDADTGKELVTLNGHSRQVNSVVFSPDGKTLASSSSDKTLKLWDVAKSKELFTLKGHTESVWTVAFSPDGKTLASPSGDATTKLWDVATGKEKATLKGHRYRVMAVEFHPDGKSLASADGGFQGGIKLWELATGKEHATLQGHTESVWAVAYSPNGQTLASASSDKTIKLWNVATGKEQSTLVGHTDRVQSVAFSPDGQTLASASFDKTIKLWDMSGVSPPSVRTYFVSINLPRLENSKKNFDEVQRVLKDLPCAAKPTFDPKSKSWINANWNYIVGGPMNIQFPFAPTAASDLGDVTKAIARLGGDKSKPVALLSLALATPIDEEKYASLKRELATAKGIDWEHSDRSRLALTEDGGAKLEEIRAAYVKAGITLSDAYKVAGQ